MADNAGNIGYIMLIGVPNRKDKTPNIGNRVLDGTTTAYDWDGLVPISKLPWTINPKKGFIAVANNRALPDNTNDDIGANSMSTARAQRLDEVIRGWIDSGEKVTIQDMRDLQQDDLDIVARELTPRMINIARKVAHELTPQQRTAMESSFKVLEGWGGRMDKDTIPPTIYQYTMLFIFKSLMHKHYPDD
jgi:penicillin amidase